MRSNRASAPWISTCTLSSWPSGKNSRLWSVVKATMSPIVGAVGSPWIASQPASQYTNAGVMLKIVPMIMKNQRPTIAWRIWSAARRAFRPRNRLTELACWPNVLDRSMPLTLQRLLGQGGHLGQRLLGLGARPRGGPCRRGTSGT